MTEATGTLPAPVQDTSVSDIIAWDDQAPKGGRAVLNRMLKEGFKVPLFLGQTFVNSLRDVGYNNTIWAVCEHVDNAIEWGAKEVRVYFNERGRSRNGQQQIDVAILDDGEGMEPSVLQVAMSFGGSLVYGRRDGIGRFGVGMKTAALSIGPRLDVYSWRERGAVYTMTLDLEEIGASRLNLIELPEPQFRDRLPSEAVQLLTSYMSYPKRGEETQRLVCVNPGELTDTLPPHGTLIYIPDCDRLSQRTAKSLVDHATREMARIYRYFLSSGTKLYVNNRLVEPFDPTYTMPNAWHTKVEGVPPGDGGRLMGSWDAIQIPVSEGSPQTAPASVRLYALPIDAWYNLPRKTLRNDLQIFDDHQVSFLRNHREVDIGVVPDLSGKKHGDSVWLRIQVDFDGRLDEAFGVSMTKQGVRPRKYALQVIRKEIEDDVRRIRENTASYRSKHAKSQSKGQVMDAERQANETEALLATPLPVPHPVSDEEKRILDANLRALAVTLKRDQETDDDAYERLLKSKYVIRFGTDEDWPFYKADFQYGKVILTVNTAHAFYSKLYKPLEELAVGTAAQNEEEPGSPPSSEAGSLLITLQLMLLSLARTQSEMGAGDDRDRWRDLFKTFQRSWSDNLNKQLTIE